VVSFVYDSPIADDETTDGGHFQWVTEVGPKI